MRLRFSRRPGESLDDTQERALATVEAFGWWHGAVRWDHTGPGLEGIARVGMLVPCGPIAARFGPVSREPGSLDHYYRPVLVCPDCGAEGSVVDGRVLDPHDAGTGCRVAPRRELRS